jgi:hypothetical protein
VKYESNSVRFDNGRRIGSLKHIHDKPDSY